MNKTKKEKVILLIETEAIIAIDIKLKLESEGYKVRTISTAEKALKLMTSFRPDLILTAIHLNGEMDGIEFASFIQKEKNIPVIYLTALDYMKNDPRLIATRPVGVLGKPVSDNDLLEMINKAFQDFSV